MTVKYVKLNPHAREPVVGSEYAAGYDIHACVPNGVHIKPGETVKVGTGLAIAPPKGYFAAIFARSGLATKEGLRPANCVGVCDFDYRGEYIVALHNDSDAPRVVSHGDRIAQVVFLPYKQVRFMESDILDDTARGSGGFGSSGK